MRRGARRLALRYGSRVIHSPAEKVRRDRAAAQARKDAVVETAERKKARDEH